VFKVKYERRKGYLPETYFNPNSINLYDEDIQAILQSGGLIGLILDERVLGYSNRDKCKEFVSKDEFSKFLSPDDSRVDFPMMSDDEDIQDDLEDVAMEYEEESLMAGYGGLRSFTKKRIHLLHLLNNIMHIIKVGNKLEGIDASKHISIGSDFDGLINAIDVCPSAEEYEDLKRELSLFIDVYASDLIPNSVMFVNDMFYNNGVNFLNNNFNS
jgi:microsomal dipeptidase-like Zn-dependent dipeptidase